METPPNTRARRKRELEAEESIVWGRDDSLLREFTLSSKPVPLPSPTQRARPITASASSGSGTLTANARKRCRSRLRSAASVPPRSEDGRRLDELLDRFLDVTSATASAASRPGSAASTPITNCSSLLSTATATATAGSSCKTTSSSTATGTRQPMAERQIVGVNGVNAVKAANGSGSSYSTPGMTRNSNTNTPVLATRSLPPKAAVANPSTRRTVSSNDLNFATKSSPRAFRSPLLNPAQAPVRSSPRRTATRTTETPLRAPQPQVQPVPVPARAAPLHSSSSLSRSPVTSVTHVPPVPPAASVTHAAPIEPVPSAPSRDTDHVGARAVKATNSHARAPRYPHFARDPVPDPKSINAKASDRSVRPHAASRPPAAPAPVPTTRSAAHTRAPAPQFHAPPPPQPQPSSDGDTSIDSFDGFFESAGAELDDLFAAMDGRK